MSADETRVAAKRDAPEEDEKDDELRGSLVKGVVAVFLNVGVLTALLVYFGWVRSEVMASSLGIDQAIFGMTVDDYVRRSVRSVILLPIAAAAGGLVWVWFNQWWLRRRRDHGEDDRLTTWFATWMWAMAAGVIAAGGALWLLGYAATYIAGPFVCAAGIMLLLYGIALRGKLPGAMRMEPMTEGILRGSVAVLVVVGLFWSAANWAEVEGTELAADYEQTVLELPGVEVDSTVPLSLDGSGVETLCAGSGENTRYRYRGLRLLESTGGKYFLVPEDWSMEYGVVLVLPADDERTRFTFVRDANGVRDEGGFTGCPAVDAPEQASTPAG